jgi:hypothetical protein
MKKRNLRLTCTLLIITILTLTVALSPISATTSTAPVRVSYYIQSDWGIGYTFNMIIQNISQTLIPGGWRLSFTLLGDQKISYPYPPIVVQSGSEVVYYAPYYMAIPAGGSVGIGFSITGMGRGITNVKFNGIPVGIR